MYTDFRNEVYPVSIDYSANENLKMKLLGMIHSAENPFDIIMEVARALEESTHERGYADKIRDNLRTVYGLLLHDKKLLTDELHDVEERLARIEASAKREGFSEEEYTRMNFAIVLHKKNIERLKGLIHHAEVYHEDLYIEK